MVENVLETLGGGLLVTVFAMGIVFAVLIVLALIIMLQSQLLKDRTKPEAGGHKNDVAVSKKTVDIVPTAAISKAPSEDAEVAAAIIAAICAYTNLSKDEFRITAIKRINGNESSWRNAGIIQ